MYLYLLINRHLNTHLSVFNNLNINTLTYLIEQDPYPPMVILFMWRYTDEGVKSGNQLLRLIVHHLQYTLTMLLCTKRKA